ncbi:MAG TPA: hypothetical protein VFM44_13040, partial [Gemmatimonadota bacterium]|nr:hypothetical protein [Gemmatimonadota bacterium]
FTTGRHARHGPPLMELRGMPMRKRGAMMTAGLVVGFLAACAPTIARHGDLVRITPERGERIQGSLVEWGPDSIAIAAAGVGVSLARDSIERLDVDTRRRSPWRRVWECAMTALYGGVTVSEIRSDEAARAAVYGGLTGMGLSLCLEPHAWARARLPDTSAPSTSAADSMPADR